MEDQQLASPSRQCSSTAVGFDQGFINKDHCDNTGLSSIIPDLAAAGFYLVPRRKSALKRRRFCDAADIIENATQELKRLSQNGCQEYFQQLYSHFRKCIFAQGDF
jgi:hypothetical protein